MAVTDQPGSPGAIPGDSFEALHVNLDPQDAILLPLAVGGGEIPYWDLDGTMSQVHETAQTSRYGAPDTSEYVLRMSGFVTPLRGQAIYRPSDIANLPIRGNDDTAVNTKLPTPVAYQHDPRTIRSVVKSPLFNGHVLGNALVNKEPVYVGPKWEEVDGELVVKSGFIALWQRLPEA